MNHFKKPAKRTPENCVDVSRCVVLMCQAMVVVVVVIKATFVFTMVGWYAM